MASEIWHHSNSAEQGWSRQGNMGAVDEVSRIGTSPVAFAAGRPVPRSAHGRSRADWTVLALAAAALGWGWATRADPRYDPHGWPGYLLGLGGSMAMLLVLGFSWRKRSGTGRFSVGAWYNAHILLGVIGPVAVLIHARFAWGSINSGFALAACLLVVASGLVARYLLPLARRSGHRAAGAVVELWHYLHLPLYAVLVVAVLVHVYMAHAY